MTIKTFWRQSVKGAFSKALIAALLVVPNTIRANPQACASGDCPNTTACFDSDADGVQDTCINSSFICTARIFQVHATYGPRWTRCKLCKFGQQCQTGDCLPGGESQTTVPNTQHFGGNPCEACPEDFNVNDSGATQELADTTHPDVWSECAGDLTTSSSPAFSTYPIDLRRGDKVMSETDVVVALPGRDYLFERRYSSALGLERPAWLGEQWATPSLSFVKYFVESDISNVQYFHSGNARFDFVEEPSGQNEPSIDLVGSSNTTLRASAIGTNGSSGHEIRIHEPGRWSRVFYGRVTNPTRLRGRLKEEVDSFGNVIEYHWRGIGPRFMTQSEPSIFLIGYLRLASIDPSTGNRVTNALIDFQWEQTGIDSVDFDRSMRLRAVRVFRRTSPGVDSYELTQEVNYTYYEDLEPDGNASTLLYGHLGRSGDLVQVERLTSVEGSAAILEDQDGQTSSYSPLSEANLTANIGSVSRIDESQLPSTFPSPSQDDDYYPNLEEGEELPFLSLIRFDATSALRRQVTQYRYYAGNPDTNGGFSHQLRLVIEPAQIEFYEWQTGNSSDDLLDLEDGDTAISAESITVADLASKIITYDTDSMSDFMGCVSEQVVQSACACGSGAHSQGKKLTYTYVDEDTGYGPGNLIKRTVVVEESLYDDSTDDYTIANKTTWYDFEEVDFGNGQYDDLLRYMAVNEGDVDDVTNSSKRVWVTKHEYYDSSDSGSSNPDGDPGQKKRVYSPSAIEAYWRSDLTDPINDPIANPPVTGSYVNEHSDVVATTGGAGLVEHFTYYSDDDENRRLKTRSVSKVERAAQTTNDPSFPDLSLIEHLEYSSEATRDDLVTRMARVRIEGESSLPTSAGDVENTWFQYTFGTFDVGVSGTAETLKYIATRETFEERETVSENGPAAGSSGYVPPDGWDGNDTGSLLDTYKTVETFRRDGLLESAWNADGSAEAFEYDDHTGALTKSILGYYDHALFEGSSESPQALVTTYTNDSLGRLVATISPSGAMTSIRREIRDDHPDDDPDGAGSVGNPDRYAIVTIPPLVESSPLELDGPAVVAFLDAADRGIGELGATVTSLTRDSEGNVTAYSLNLTTPLNRSYVEREVSGLARSSIAYHNIADAEFYETEFEYDQLGRVASETNANGTIRRFTYDVMDRVVQEEIGTDASPSGNMSVVGEFFYDSGGTTTQGVGDGNLTLIRRDDGSANRDTEFVYDSRNRSTATVNPLPPHTLSVYDNLDRVVADGVYSSTPPATIDLFSIPSDSARGSLELYDYSQRGLQYRQRRAIDSTEAAPDYLESNFWFDPVSRAVAEWHPTGSFTKRVFDSLGRISTEFMTDGRDDAGPGQTGGYADAIDVSDDVVVRQTEFRYIDMGGSVSSGLTAERGAGAVDLTTTRLRTHDALVTDTDDLSDSSNSDISINSFMGSFYDDADRRVASVEYGTNTTGFDTGGSAPSIIQSTPPSPATYLTDATKLVTAYAYNSRGLVEELTDPENRVTKAVFDDLNRLVAVIENFVDAVVSRGTTNVWVWDADLGNDEELSDEDRVSIRTYNGIGQEQFRIAAFWDGAAVDYQVTEYKYGVNSSTGSSISSGDLLERVIYPDEYDLGSPNAFVYSYNKQGELVEYTDAAGTTHALDRDARGRVEDDTVTTFASGLDTTVKTIEYERDSFDRIIAIRSLNSSSTTLNEVEFDYSTLWQIEEVWQDPDSAVDRSGNDATSRAASYTYTLGTVNGSAGNYSRLTTLRYPTPSEEEVGDPFPVLPEVTVDVNYGSSGSLDNRISRSRGLGWYNAGTYEFYETDFVGMGLPVQSEFTYIDVRFDRFSDPVTGAQTAGEYPTLDRFGRPTRQLWVESNWDPTTIPGVAIALIDLGYTYDNVSNVLTRSDRRGEDSVSGKDELYEYDDLNRMTLADKGTLNHGTGVLTRVALGEQWTLDALGNWLSVVTNDDGTPATFSATDTEEVGTYTLANEIVDFGDDSGSVPDFTYSDDGLLTSRERAAGGSITSTWDYIYDGWGRVVGIDVTPSGGSTQTRAEYTYYGQHERATRNVDSDFNGTVDQRRVYYYDAAWRLLEEHIDDDWGGSSFAPDRYIHRVWGPNYIDEQLFFQIDTDGDLDFTDIGSSGVEGYYTLTDREFSPIVTLDRLGQLYERVRFSAYGEPTHELAFDPNGDGALNRVDETAVTNAVGEELGDAGYIATYDDDRDGDIDSTDVAAATSGLGTTAEPAGEISTADNTVGFAGYQHDRAVLLSLARHRWLDSETGKWLTRDPAEYADGLSLYQYVGGSPLAFSDPLGSQSEGIQRFEDLVSSGFDCNTAATIIQLQAERSSAQSSGAVAQLELEQSRLYRLQGGLSVTANTLTFGGTDFLGLTDAAQYQGSGFDLSRLIAGGARELGIATATLGAGSLIQAGRAGMAARAVAQTGRTYEAVQSAQGQSHAIRLAARGQYGAAALTSAFSTFPMKRRLNSPRPPQRLARVVEARFANSPRLGGPNAKDVFVTVPEDVAGVTNSTELAKRLTLLENNKGKLISGPFVVIEFDNPIAGFASPIFRQNPGFVGRGFTQGGAREFVIPNSPVSELRNVTRRTIE